MSSIQLYHNFSKENTVEPVLPNANSPIVNVCGSSIQFVDIWWYVLVGESEWLYNVAKMMFLPADSIWYMVPLVFGTLQN